MLVSAPVRGPGESQKARGHSWLVAPVGALALSLAFGGCSAPTTPPWEGVSDASLSAAEQRFAGVEAENREFEQLRRGDGDVEAFVESVYSPDIVFNDESMGDHRQGREAAVQMYTAFLYFFEDAAIDYGKILVGAETALQANTFTSVSLGDVEFTESDPLIEVDLLEMDEGLVASNVIYYDLASLRRLIAEADDLDGNVQRSYADAWTSGDRGRIASLYSADARRYDGLVNSDSTGIDQILAEAERWGSSMPDGQWELLVPFGATHARSSATSPSPAGGIYRVSTGQCDVTVGIVFAVDDQGLITSEVLHYDPETVRECAR